MGAPMRWYRPMMGERLGRLYHRGRARWTDVRVHESLQEMTKVDERMAQVVEMRYFGGLTDLEIAGALGVTDRTVRRDWEQARLFLAEALK